VKLCPACGHEWHLGKERCSALHVVPAVAGCGVSQGEEVLCSCNCDDSKAAKADAGKPRGFRMLPPDTLAELAEIYTYGCQKYARDSWRNVPDAVERYYDAMERHLGAFNKGEEFDVESGKRHLAHALWNLVAVCELTRKP
jgi:hypothetical protein